MNVVVNRGRQKSVVIERLEDRRLLSADPLAFQNVVQALPFALDFTHPVNGVLDSAGQSTGFTRVQVNKNGTQYQPSLLNLNTDAGELDVTTSSTSTSGTNIDGDNTQVNALETQFDGTTSGFTITARVRGPLSQLASAYDQGGIYFGPDQDNFIKLVAEDDATRGPVLQFTDEQGGSVHTVNDYASAGDFNSITTLQLRLTGDAAAGTVSASFAVDSGAFSTLGQVVTLTGSEKTAFFNSAARAGILTSTQNDQPAIQVRFGRFEIDPGTPVLAHPSILDTSPQNGDTNVSRAAFVSSNLNLPNGGLDSNTLGSSTVQLFRTSDNARINAVVNTSAAGDALVLQPMALLDANTQYSFKVTSGVKDIAGVTLQPFQMNFTTGANSDSADPAISFQKQALATATGTAFTTLKIGPDGLLYASTETGLFYRWRINSNGTLGPGQVITALQDANGGPRLVTGFAFDPASTADNLKLWVSNGLFAFTNAPDWSSKITVMSGPGLGTVQDAVINLPRSVRDHLTNSPTFGPDGALYFGQGSDTAFGAPDTVWGLRTEHLLTAAILRLDVTKITPGTPLDVKTSDGGTYNPFAAGAPLTIYATGVRNAYSLLWTRDGTLYAPTNGSSSGGNAPGFPNTINGPRIDTGEPFNGPAVPALNAIPQAELDWLYNVKPGKYYGHPNAYRGEYILDDGNPAGSTDPNNVPQYASGTEPDPNYGGYAFNFGLHRSPDGIIEYQDHTFGGRLQGALLVSEYSGGNDIIALSRDANGNITNAARGITGLTFLNNPISLVEDNSNGNIYVAELGGQNITLLRPVDPGPTNGGAPAAPGALTASPNSTGQVTLNWTTPVGNVTAYHVERMGPGDSAFVEISGAIAGMQFVDSATSPSSHYVYRVRAENAGSFSAYSATAAADTPAPSIPSPTGLSATAGAGQVTLAWTPPAGDVTGYRVQRMGPGDGAFADIATGVTATSFADANVAPGGSYTYRVIAENTTGSSAASDPSSAVVPDVPGLARQSAFPFASVTRSGNWKAAGRVGPGTTEQFYSFTLTSATKFSLKLSGLRFNADVQLLDGNGNVITSSTRPGRKSEAISGVLGAGTYYIRVYLVGDGTTAYRLALSGKMIRIKPARRH